MSRLKRGLVHVYTGNGKGKTTAAIGLGVRAAGNGLKVYCYQFLKGKAGHCGEVKAGKSLGPDFEIIQLGQCHPCFAPPAERKRIKGELRESTQKTLREIKKDMIAEKYDLIILDEIITSVRDGFADIGTVLGIIDAKPKHVELVLTGRGALPALIRKADYATEMREMKHPFKKGIKARCGIEY